MSSLKTFSSFHIKGLGFRVIEEIATKYHYDLDGDLDDVIARIESDRDLARLRFVERGFNEKDFEKSCRVFYVDNSFYEDFNLSLRMERPETKAERKVRLDKAKAERQKKEAVKAEKEAAELAEYERLKKKFG